MRDIRWVRRDFLPPPRTVHPRLEGVLGEVPAAGGASAAGSHVPDETLSGGSSVLGLRNRPPRRGSLAGPAPALPRLRHLFDPRRGWFRRIERDVGVLLARHVFPLIPGIDRPYGAVLDRLLTVSETTIEIAALARSFDALKVLLVTDIHTGPFLSPRCLRSAFDSLRSLEPDLVLLGGDLTTCRVSEIVPHLPAFRSFAAPLGSFAVLGNHDHYSCEPDRLSGLLESHGVRVLDNTSVTLERAGGRIVLAGIDDLYQGRPDLDAALSGVPNGAGSPPVLLLSHNPDVLFEASRRGVSLVLSGHTHGGQIRIPGLPVLVRQSRYRLDEGRFVTGETQLVVSRGLGASGLPVRLACSPEAVLVHLRRP